MVRKIGVGLWVVLFVAGVAGAQEKDRFDRAFDAVDRQMDEAMTAVDARWNAMVAAEEARWAKLRAEVEAKWDSFVAPTKKEWVDYSADRDARARVDYEKGRVVVEVLVPVETVEAPSGDDPAPVALPPQAVTKIADEVKKIARPDPEEVIGPVESQVKTAAGVPLTERNAESFVRREVAPTAVVEPKVIEGKDGVARRKVRVVIPMVDEHLYVRAARFKAAVMKAAAQYHLDPQLVFAVIHTESYFNPRARSPAMAFGLMQLIPKYGAYEALEFLEGKGRLVDPDYLYQPGNNIRLGAVYVHLLDTRYYGKVKDPLKREILVVASYNWGPTAVRRKIVDRNPIDAMSVEELRRAVDRTAPKETRDYVERVTSRKPIYDGLVLAAGGAR